MEWKITPGLTDYAHALEAMAARVAAIQAGEAEELVWLVEHPPLYTAGSSAKGSDLLSASGFPVYETGRGGQYTYHGPGQRVVYVMRNLKKHAGAAGPDLRAYVQQLEQWIILTLGQFGITGFIRDGRVGVWVSEGLGIRDSEGMLRGTREAEGDAALLAGGSVAWGTRSPSINSEAKIAALGVRVQKWVTSHGIAINVNPDLSHYAGIVPCGLREFGVTSMQRMGCNASMSEVDAALQTSFASVFGDLDATAAALHDSNLCG